MKLAVVLFVLLLLAIPIVLGAADFNQDLTAQEQETLNEILRPVMKVYNFIKYAASVIGVLMLVFAGITVVTSGGDTGKKEKAKNMAAGVVFGLILIWVAPLIVRYLLS